MRDFVRGLSAVMYKECRQALREPVTLALIALLPVIQLLIYGYAINMHVEHIKTLVLNQDDGRSGDRVVQAMRSSRAFDVVGRVQNEAEIRGALVSGRAQCAVVIPEDFTYALRHGDRVTVQLYIDGSDATLAQAAIAAANDIGTGLALKAADVRQTVSINRQILFNPQMRTPNFLVPGFISMLMLNLTMLLTLLSVVGERERGTLDQLRLTPVPTAALVAGKMLPYGILGFADFILVLGIMVAVFNVHIAGNVALLAALGAAGLVTGLGMGLLISTFARTQLQAVILCLFYVLPAFLLSGMFFRIELMPKIIQGIAYLLPLTYMLQILRGIILRGASFSDLWLQVAALCALGAATIAVAGVRFARTLE